MIPEGIRSYLRVGFFTAEMCSRYPFHQTLKTIGAGAFSNCRLLTCVILPDSVTTLEPAAFEQSGIQELKLSGNIRVIEGAVFKGCDMREVTLPGQLGDHRGIRLQQLPPTGSTSICRKVWKRSTAMLLIIAIYSRDVTFPASLERIGLEAFSQCKRLKDGCSAGQVARD